MTMVTSTVTQYRSDALIVTSNIRGKIGYPRNRNAFLHLWEILVLFFFEKTYNATRDVMQPCFCTIVMLGKKFFPFLLVKT